MTTISFIIFWEWRGIGKLISIREERCSHNYSRHLQEIIHRPLWAAREAGTCSRVCVQGMKKGCLVYLYWSNEDVPHPGRALRRGSELKQNGARELRNAKSWTWVCSKKFWQQVAQLQGWKANLGSGTFSEEPDIKPVISWAALCFCVIPGMQQEPVQTCTFGFSLAGQGRT